MKLSEALSVLEEIAPVKLSDEFCKDYGLYDNSGIILDSGNEVNGALFSLDFSKKTVERAKKHGYNLIVTHHPAIYGGVSRFNTVDPKLAALAQCIKNGISVISMHLNFDAAPQGIDYFLMRGLGGTEAQILSPVSKGGYGRIYSVAPQVYADYADKVKMEFQTERSQVFGDLTKKVKKVASFCGAGCDNKAINFAAENGADVFVSSDMKHHEIAELLDRGINVIHLTHYSAENYGFNKIYLKIKDRLSVPSAYFCDVDLI